MSNKRNAFGYLQKKCEFGGQTLRCQRRRAACASVGCWAEQFNLQCKTDDTIALIEAYPVPKVRFVDRQEGGTTRLAQQHRDSLVFDDRTWTQVSDEQDGPTIPAGERTLQVPPQELFVKH